MTREKLDKAIQLRDDIEEYQTILDFLGNGVDLISISNERGELIVDPENGAFQIRYSSNNTTRYIQARAKKGQTRQLSVDFHAGINKEVKLCRSAAQQNFKDI